MERLSHVQDRVVDLKCVVSVIPSQRHGLCEESSTTMTMYSDRSRASVGQSRVDLLESSLPIGTVLVHQGHSSLKHRMCTVKRRYKNRVRTEGSILIEGWFLSQHP